MIYTMTLNPAIDFLTQVPELQVGTLNRATDEQYFAGGKGINVSRVIKRLGVENIALGFIGGFTGEFIKEQLAQEKIATNFTRVTGTSRINVKVHGQSETAINTSGPAVTAAELEQLLNQLDQLKTKDIVVISGSTPKNVPKSYLLEMVQRIHATGAQFILDVEGLVLLDALPYQPLLLKPNQDELAELFGEHALTAAQIDEYGHQLVAKGAQHVIVSLGGAGAILYTSQGKYRADPVIGTVKNTVGAGDSVVAGFVATWQQSHDALTSFKYGVAAGTATAFHDDLATQAQISDLLSKIHIIGE